MDMGMAERMRRERRNLREQMKERHPIVALLCFAAITTTTTGSTNSYVGFIGGHKKKAL